MRMLNQQPNQEQPIIHIQQERTLKALTLLLSVETDDAMRSRAARQLARQGAVVLPLLVTTLHHYPEIIMPPWPSWPPQYEHCGRLLMHLCQNAHTSLEELLQHPTLTQCQPIGPVLWTSVVEAAALRPHTAYEPLLRNSLAAPWETTRYAAAMALANLTGPLHETTLAALRSCQCTQEAAPVRLAASYALLRSKDSCGVAVLIQLLADNTLGEVRKATAFVLATEPPTLLSPHQHEQLTQLLLSALMDKEHDMSQHAAHALGSIALPSTPPLLYPLLKASLPFGQIAALLALEEMAHRKDLRRVMQQHMLPTSIRPLLRSDCPAVRRQASYTLAAIGGEYVTAVLGTALLAHGQTGQIEAIEGLRLLHGVLRQPTRTKVVQWLLSTLDRPGEKIQVTALDSLAYLLWQTRTQRYRKANAAIGSAIIQNGTPWQLLASPYAWVRQRAIELLCMLANQLPTLANQLICFLQTDADSGVRACAAYMLRLLMARQAIPALLYTLCDVDEHVAITALHTLGQLATAADAIILYCLQELALAGDDELAAAARLLLKKWRGIARVYQEGAKI